MVAAVAAVEGVGQEGEVRRDALLVDADAVAHEVRDEVGAARGADHEVGDVVVRTAAVREAGRVRRGVTRWRRARRARGAGSRPAASAGTVMSRRSSSERTPGGPSCVVEQELHDVSRGVGGTGTPETSWSAPATARFAVRGEERRLVLGQRGVPQVLPAEADDQLVHQRVRHARDLHPRARRPRGASRRALRDPARRAAA